MKYNIKKEGEKTKPFLLKDEDLPVLTAEEDMDMFLEGVDEEGSVAREK